jgi:hypothetical protein
MEWNGFSAAARNAIRAAAEPALGSLAVEFGAGHHRLAGMRSSAVDGISLIVRYAYHEPGGAGQQAGGVTQ